MASIWTERVVALSAKGEAGVAPFAQMTEDEITSHAFFGMLEALWNQSQRETKLTAKKTLLTDEEKQKIREDAQTEYVKSIPHAKLSKVKAKVVAAFPHLGEDDTILAGLKDQLFHLGADVLMAELEKLGKTAPTAQKTLASGRVVGNHNNYHREEGELLKDANGKKMEVLVDFKKGEELCGIIPTREMTNGFTFAELKDHKSVERAEAGYSQVFVKPMIFPKDPRHISGLCGCANGINKKLNSNAMCETINDEGVKRYTANKLTFTPTFACNGKIHANGMCKTHAKMTEKGKSVAKWSPELLGGWKVEEYNL